MKKRFAPLLKYFVVAVLFLTVTVLAIFFAYGYRFDVKERTVQKTSIIDIVTRPLEAEVFLDGKPVLDHLPEQIEGILPGNYSLRVLRQGFTPWERMVSVEEDIVSIVKDVFLIPEDVALLWEKQPVVLSERVYKGDDFWLSVDNAGFFHIYLTDTKGGLRHEVVNFPQEVFEVHELYKNGRFLLRSFGGEYRYVNVLNQEARSFLLPPGAENVHLDADRRDVYFVINGVLSMVPLDSLSDEGVFSLSSHEVAQGVLDYTFDGLGNIYCVIDGELFRIVDGEPVAEILALGSGTDSDYSLVDIRMVRKGNDAVLVVEEEEGTRSVWHMELDEPDVLIAQSIEGLPLMNSAGEVVYSDGQGGLWFYDLLERKGHVIRQMDSEFQLYGWFDGVGHFLLGSEGKLIFADVYGANFVELATEPDIVFDDLVVGEKSVYVRKGNTVTTLLLP